MLIADLSQPQDSDRWRFFTDGVMGGVSTGQAVIADGALTITGDVSTDNNGGFIQARLSDVLSRAGRDHEISFVLEADERTDFNLIGSA